MKFANHNHRGSFAIEAVALTMILIVALLVFGGYLSRGFSGGWKTMADSWGQGRQFAAGDFGDKGQGGGTQDCFRDRDALTGIWNWVDEACYKERNCDCTLVGFDGRELPGYEDDCRQCKLTCMQNCEQN